MKNVLENNPALVDTSVNVPRSSLSGYLFLTALGFIDTANEDEKWGTISFLCLLKPVAERPRSFEVKKRIKENGKNNFNLYRF